MSPYPTTRHRHSGFSLVELMVAMVIALILLAGILQILLGNRESFRYQQNMASLQENSRLASFIIENVIAHAGFRADLGAEPFRRGTSNGTHKADYVDRAVVAGVDGGGGKSDVLRLRFEAAGGVHDCQGREIGEAGSSPLIESADMELYVNDQDTLLCADYSGKGSKISQPIIEQVQRFNVVYGVDTSGDGSADTYVDAPTAANGAGVVSLRIQLLLRSEANVLPSPVTRTYPFADGSSFTTSSTDRHAYQFIDQMVALRNRLP
ncbi:PilW family protein [Salinisphaera sp. T31B1]|uniref:PilW family protein n=1 Tax=Salinisphaera sp. T31B1 TaxID=727963 RepID=UPI00333EC939